MDDTQLKKLKRRLGIEQVDTEQDELLMDLWEDAEQHFKLLSGASVIADKYTFIIRDVTALRYNRKGSEGMNSESVDGYSASYDTGKHDFDDYLSIIDKDFNLAEARRGKVRFL